MPHSIHQPIESRYTSLRHSRSDDTHIRTPVWKCDGANGCGFEATEKFHAPPTALSMKLTPISGASCRVTNNRRKKKHRIRHREIKRPRSTISPSVKFFERPSFSSGLLTPLSLPSTSLLVRPLRSRPRARANSPVK